MMGEGPRAGSTALRAVAWARKGSGSWAAARLVVAVALGAGGCGPHRQGVAAEVKPEKDAPAVLRERATRVWEARQVENWEAVLECQDPREREGVDVAAYVKWCQENEPFRTHSFKLGQVSVEGDMGWVEVNYNTSMRRFPDVPPRDATQWEKWRRVEGAWYPVPRSEMESYPAPPAMRDLPQETRLLARFKASWEFRQRADWPGLYEFGDPEDRSEVSLDDFTRIEELFEYLSYEVQWVQVMGDHGIVHVAYRHKLSDPSLTKMAPKTLAVDERWVSRQGEWYLDLKRPK